MDVSKISREMMEQFTERYDVGFVGLVGEEGELLFSVNRKAMDIQKLSILVTVLRGAVESLLNEKLERIMIECADRKIVATRFYGKTLLTAIVKKETDTEAIYKYFAWVSGEMEKL